MHTHVSKTRSLVLSRGPCIKVCLSLYQNCSTPTVSSLLKPKVNSSVISIPFSLFVCFFKTHPVQFTMSMYSWVCVYPLEHGKSSRGHTPEESSPSPVQLPWFPQPGMVFHAHLPCTGLVQDVTTTVNLDVQLSCYVQKPLLCCSHKLPLALIIFLPALQQWSLCPGRRKCGRNIPL